MHPILLFSSLLLLAAIYLYRRSPSRTLPPGPKPLPLVGNLFQLRPNELWLLAQQWAQKHASDVIYIHVFGIPLLFLSSPDAAADLLEKRGAIYSDKPAMVMAGELCNCQNMVAFTPYGDLSRRQRRILNKALGPGAIPSFHPLIKSQTATFLQRLARDPDAYTSCLRLYAGSLTLSVVYGYQPKGPDDEFLRLAEDSVDILSNGIAGGGGVWAVDVFPWLKHVPSWLEWLPGMGFKQKARVWRAKMEEFVDKPYEYLKQSMKSGNYHPSFCSTLLLDRPDSPEFESDLKWTANSMYGASMDTTIAVVTHLLLLLSQHPRVLAKAQAEILAAVGPARLPSFSDRACLPYVDCVLSEVYRCAAPVPLGLPHRVKEDDVYRGWHVPRGALVFANIYAILRDPALFDHPDEFRPERYAYPPLGEMRFGDEEARRREVEWRKRRDPRSYVFGFGRRVCPGASLVEDSIWLLVVCLLATMDVGKAKEEVEVLTEVQTHGGEAVESLDGEKVRNTTWIKRREVREVEPEVKFENSIFRTPSTFKVDIRPHSEQALKLISEGFNES